MFSITMFMLNTHLLLVLLIYRNSSINRQPFLQKRAQCVDSYFPFIKSLMPLKQTLHN